MPSLTNSLGIVFCSQEQLWCTIPEGDHNWIQLSQRFQWGIKQPSKSHVSCVH